MESQLAEPLRAVPLATLRDAAASVGIKRTLTPPALIRALCAYMEGWKLPAGAAAPQEAAAPPPAPAAAAEEEEEEEEDVVVEEEEKTEGHASSRARGAPLTLDSLPAHLRREVAGYLSAHSTFNASAASRGWLAAWRPVHDWGFVRCASWDCKLPGRRFPLAHLFVPGSLQPPNDGRHCPGEQFEFIQCDEVYSHSECCGGGMGWPGQGCAVQPHRPKLRRDVDLALRPGDPVWVCLHQRRRTLFTAPMALIGLDGFGELDPDDPDTPSPQREAELFEQAMEPLLQTLACGLSLPLVKRTRRVQGTVVSAPGEKLGKRVIDVQLIKKDGAPQDRVHRDVPLSRVEWRLSPSSS